jgi:hypothetical protein
MEHRSVGAYEGGHITLSFDRTSAEPRVKSQRSWGCGGGHQSNIVVDVHRVICALL